MKKFNKLLVSSLALGTILSSTFITSSHADTKSDLSTIENYSKIESSSKNGVVGADKFLSPRESYTISVSGTNAALFTVMAYNHPNTVNIKISDSYGNVFLNEAFVDLTGQYNHYMHGLQPSKQYNLTVTNLSTSTLAVGMMITPGVR